MTKSEEVLKCEALIRELYAENADLRRKVEFLSGVVARISSERDSLRKRSNRYHDPEDRSWRAWPSDDAAD